MCSLHDFKGDAWLQQLKGIELLACAGSHVDVR